ncbi:unnamed protein product [Vicia faba]|uniref:Uncharacterized protein n=1 Tax=Vicia faba TaxID=3906 RepID=A0AAV0YHJ5_VICFA|nr:unnamed protein product [Vicia faba]
MATSVDNRQYRGLNSVVRTFNPNNNFIHELKLGFPVNLDPFSSDDEDDDDNTLNLQELIRKTNTEVEPSILDPRDEGTLDNWVTRNASMVRLAGKHPFNSEAPLPRLMHHGSSLRFQSTMFETMTPSRKQDGRML